MKFVVMVTVSEGEEPEPVGPFPDSEWAARYVERVGWRYYRCELVPLLSPRLLDVDEHDVATIVFDPDLGVDYEVRQIEQMCFSIGKKVR